MSDFIASLDSPLGIPKPNILALVSFDLPIAKGDKIHCLDVLHSLTKYTLGFVDDGDEDFGKVGVIRFMSTLVDLILHVPESFQNFRRKYHLSIFSVLTLLP